MDSVCHGEEEAEPKSKALDLLVNLRSYTHPWSRTVGVKEQDHRYKQRNEFPPQGGWALRGEKFRHPGGSQSRAAALPHQEGPDEVARASRCLLDASLCGCPERTGPEENPGHVSRLTPQDPPHELEEVAKGELVFKTKMRGYQICSNEPKQKKCYDQFGCFNHEQPPQSEGCRLGRL